MKIISTRTLSKHFRSTRAVDNITLQVKQGEIYGFLGLNGAGKTTLIRLLLGMIKPTSGDVYLFDKKLKITFDQWNDVGYLVETPHAYPNLSVAENLGVYYHLRHLTDRSLLPAIIDTLKLTPYKDVKAKYLSLGNQQRLGLAKALMHQPKLLILDEPINGLDPEGIVELRTLIKRLAASGVTVFLSSHILGEISRVANRIGIIHQGKLIKELTTEELTDQLVKCIIIKTNDNKSAMQQLADADHHPILNKNNEIEISNARAITNPEEITKLLVEKGIPPKQVFLFQEDLEMYFLRTIKTAQNERTA